MNYEPILEVVVGSTLHGTSVNDGLEDLDLMAIVIENKFQSMGFYREDTWVTRTKPSGVRSEAGDTDHVAYGLRKYLMLATKGNPTILLALFAPMEHVRFMSPEGQQLQELAPKIVSQQAFGPFRGYMKQQHERLLGTLGQKNVTRPELVEKYGFDTKYAGHIIRLGYQGQELLMTGRITLPMPIKQREHVLAVRCGKYQLSEVSEMISDLEHSLVVAGRDSTLPMHADIKFLDKWMIQTYLRHYGDAR